MTPRYKFRAPDDVIRWLRSLAGEPLGLDELPSISSEQLLSALRALAQHLPGEEHPGDIFRLNERPPRKGMKLRTTPEGQAARRANAAKARAAKRAKRD